MSTRAKLAKGKKVSIDDAPRTVPQLKSSRSERVLLSKYSIGASANRWVKLIAGVAALSLGLLAVIYIGLAATLMTAVPGDGLSRVWVARGTFVGNNVPSQSMIYASATSVKPDNFINRILEGVIGAPDGLVAEVIAGPYGNISNTPDGGVLHNDTIVPGYSGEVEPYFLNNEYLAVCYQGACAKGELIIVPSRNISGEAQSVISLEGVRSLEGSDAR